MRNSKLERLGGLGLMTIKYFVGNWTGSSDGFAPRSPLFLDLIQEGQDLYKEFIEAADALQHEKPEMSALVDLYAKIGRMRLLSSPTGASMRAPATA
jgi:hypothetical protein